MKKLNNFKDWFKGFDLHRIGKTTYFYTVIENSNYNVLSYLFNIWVLLWGIILLYKTDISFISFIYFLLYTSFAWTANHWRTNRGKRIFFASISFIALFIWLASYKIDFEIVTIFAYFIPYTSVYMFRNLLFSNIIVTILSFLLLTHRGQESFKLTVILVIGLLSLNTAISIVFHFVQNHRKKQLKNNNASTTDTLTGLPCLDYIMKTGQQILDRGNSLTLLVVDLDEFRQVNETYGHMIGNKVIIGSADILKIAMKGFKYTMGRLGGDEFIILIQGLSFTHAKTINLRIHESFSKNGIEVDPDIPPIKLSCSAGIACSDDQPGLKIQELLQEADRKMHDSKYEKYQKDTIFNLEEDVLPKRCNEILDVLKDKDVYTYIHSHYVAQYAVALGKALQLPEKMINDLYIAGWLHDIGKFFVSSVILRKPNKLSDEEYNVIKNHVADGAVIIDMFDISDTVKNAVKYHHERWDGLGYPFGLNNENIPLEGRILEIADVFSAMTIKRVYRKRLAWDEAIAEIKQCSGKQFDPRLVEIFTNLIRLERQFPGGVIMTTRNAGLH